MKTWKSSNLYPKVRTGDQVYKYDYQFTWTKRHLKGHTLEKMRYKSDNSADHMVSTIIRAKGDTYVDKLYTVHDRKLDNFKKEIETVPNWVDFDQIKRGQQVYLKNQVLSKMILLHSSLIGGFGASKIVKTLTCTAYLNNKKTTYKRLIETAKLLTDSMEFEQLKPGGKGWKTIVNVRLMHSKVRKHIEKLGKKHYDQELYGVPINQEDMISTILVFSVNIIDGLLKIGVSLSDQEIDDYLAVWRYIAYLIGVKDERKHLISYKRSKQLYDSLVMHVQDTNEHSRQIALNVLSSFSFKAPFYFWFRFQAHLCAFFLGKRWAQELGLINKEETLLDKINIQFVYIYLQYTRIVNNAMLYLFDRYYTDLVTFIITTTNAVLLNYKEPDFQFRPIELENKEVVWKYINLSFVMTLLYPYVKSYVFY